MGLYDTVEIDGQSGQVKLWWDELRTLGVGDEVPSIDGKTTYNVAMREGGYVHVEDRKITGWKSEPMTIPVYDKYGATFTENSRGILGTPDSYLFDRKLKS